VIFHNYLVKVWHPASDDLSDDEGLGDGVVDGVELNGIVRLGFVIALRALQEPNRAPHELGCLGASVDTNHVVFRPWLIDHVSSVLSSGSHLEC
jgi:hypothetical protein